MERGNSVAKIIEYGEDMMSPENISYRRIVAGEGNLFKQIWLQALRSTPSSYASVLQDWQDLPDEEWNRRLADPVFGAFSGCDPIGLMGLIRKHPAKLRHRAVVVMAYVREDYRRMGTASGLLQHVSSFAKSEGILQLELCVSAENTPAIEFYGRQHFSQLCKLPSGLIEDGRHISEVQMLRALGDKDPAERG